MSPTKKTPSPAAIWQEVECGGYAADLDLWEELAHEAPGAVLELGCGNGRVALRLARAGFEVTALDRDRELLDELERRAAAEGLAVETIAGDVGDLRLATRFGLIAAPMQLVHLLGVADRARLLARAAAHLAPGGRLAVSLLADECAVQEPPSSPLPDVLERDGSIYSSLPIEVRRANAAIEVRRLRQVVSGSGALQEEVSVTRLERVGADQLESEASLAGLRPAGRRPIAATDEHVGSIVVLLEGA